MFTRAIATTVFIAISTGASALPVEYIFDGSLTGAVSSDDTGEFIENVTALPATFIVSADTADVVSADTPPYTLAGGPAKLSLDGSPFVSDIEPAIVVLDRANNRIGQFDSDGPLMGEGFFNDTNTPAFEGYDLTTSLGPISGLVSDPFISTTILNVIYDEPVAFDGTAAFSFEAKVVPLPAALPLFAAGLGALAGLQRMRRG